MTTSTSFARRLSSFVCIGLFVAGNLHADEYKEFSKQLRQEIWASERPEFQRYDVPEQHRNESAVILALYEEVIATGKSKFRFDPNLLFTINKELNYSNMYRRMIYINDRTALENNSEISYTEQHKSVGLRVATKSRVVVGVRIIKPTGEINEIDMDEAVSVREGKKEKESHKQLAIPNLQVGDILDYFVYTEGRVDYLNMPPRYFYLSSQYPILSYSIHCEVDKRLTTEYRSVNGAPDFTESTDADGNFILDITETDIPKVSAPDWTLPSRQIPGVRLAVYFNSSTNIFKPGSHRKKGLHKDVSPDIILHDAMGYLAGHGEHVVIAQAWKLARKHFKKNPGMDDAEKAEYLNAALLYKVYMYERLYPLTYIKTLHTLLRKSKIEHKIGFVTDCFDARYDEAFHYTDFYPIIVANNGKQFFLPPYEAFNMDYIPKYEGEVIHTVSVSRMNSQSKEGIIGDYGQILFPASQPTDNMNKAVQRVEFSGENPLTLTIRKEESYTGKARNGRFPRLILYMEKVDAMTRYLDCPSVIEDIQEKGKQRNADAYHAAKEEQIKARHEAIKNTLADEYEAEVKSVLEYTYPKLGVTPDEQEVIFNVAFTADGLVKRAGNNYILDAGKLIGKQLVVSEEDRNRNIDAYMPGVRDIQDTITIAIPAGYAVERLDKLNRKVDNEYGLFLSSASMDGDNVCITVRKVYKQDKIPASDWAKCVEMLDAANYFYAQSIVFRKVND